MSCPKEGGSFGKENTLIGLRYEKQIDIELFCQMVEMVYRLSGKTDKMATICQMDCDCLFWQMPEEPIENIYDLHYPGEVLERLGEKIKLSLPKIRALALALGLTKEIQEDGMFVGTQFSLFCQKTFRNQEKQDCYLLAAKYLLAEGKEKKHVYEEVLNYPWEKIEEILFALSVLPEDDLLWEKVRENLNLCLGNEHVLDVYEDGELYLWICRHCGTRMKGYRKKDLDALKYVTRLPNEPARNGNTMQEKLVELGYTPAELHFLNGIFAKEPGLGCAQNSITAERIAVEVCKFFLNEEIIYPESVYELCGKLIENYRDFSIKLEGTEGILQYLRNELQLKNVRSYQFLFPYRKNIYQNYEDEGIFYIDLTDSSWDPLYIWLEKTEFDLLITKTIIGKRYTDVELKQFLSHYKLLTGEKYEGSFWTQQQDSIWEKAFFRLSDAGVLNPVALMGEYVTQLEENVEETKEKWECMSSYLLDFMEGIHSPEAFQMLALYMEGRERFETPEILPSKKLFFSSFGIREWSNHGKRFKDMNFLRLFLTPQEHNTLFQWLDEVIFKSIPEEYIVFLATMLEDPDTFLWMEKEEAREICFRILPLVDTYTQKGLRKRYLTEQEYEYLEQVEKESRRRKNMMKEMKICQKLKNDFTKEIAKHKAKGIVQPVFEFLKSKHYPMQSMARRIVARYLSCVCGKGRIIKITQEELTKLLKLELDLVEDKLLEIDTIRNTMLGYEED